MSICAASFQIHDGLIRAFLSFIGLLLRLRLSSHQVAPRRRDLAQLGSAYVHLCDILEPHESRRRPRALEMRELAWDPGAAIEHQVHGRFQVLDKRDAIAIEAKDDGPVLQVLGDPRISAQDDVANAPKRLSAGGFVSSNQRLTSGLRLTRRGNYGALGSNPLDSNSWQAIEVGVLAE